MKTKYLVLFAIVFMITIQYGCKKEDVKVNTINYDGKEYKLQKAYSYNYGEHPVYQNRYLYELFLCSESLELKYDNDSSFHFEGIGNYIYLALGYDDSLGLQTGDYYTYFDDGRKILSGLCGLNRNIETGIGQLVEIDDINYSHLNINTNNGVFNIDFELSGSNQKQISGNYNGQLTDIQ